MGKTMRDGTLVLSLALFTTIWQSRLAAVLTLPNATTKISGIVGDITCGREHSMMRGKTDAECTRQCVAALGSKYALITTEKVYVLEGHWQEVDALAGQKAMITGKISEETIEVSRVEKL